MWGQIVLDTLEHQIFEKHDHEKERDRAKKNVIVLDTLERSQANALGTEPTSTKSTPVASYAYEYPRRIRI